MVDYATQTLTSTEKVIYVGRLSRGMAFVSLIVLDSIFLAGALLGWWFLYFLLAITLPMTLKGFLAYRNTRFTVTTKRVIIETGWLSKKTSEIMLSKVETVSVSGSKRSGTVAITGSGGSLATLKDIQDPWAFRQYVLQAMDPS